MIARLLDKMHCMLVISGIHKSFGNAAHKCRDSEGGLTVGSHEGGERERERERENGSGLRTCIHMLE